jgi:hypothetical protein
MAISSVRLILIVVGTAAYLGVAVLGRGGFWAFFSRPALIALAIAQFALSGVALFAGGNLSSGVREDRGNRWVLVAFALIGVLGAYLPAIRTGRISGPSTAKAFAGLASLCSLWEARYGSGQSLCARSPIQRPGGHPARAHPGHERGL